jgi:hypothetical protein
MLAGSSFGMNIFNPVFKRQMQYRCQMTFDAAATERICRMVQLIDLFKIQRCQLGLFLCQKYDRFAPFFEQRSLLNRLNSEFPLKNSWLKRQK